MGPQTAGAHFARGCLRLGDDFANRGVSILLDVKIFVLVHDLPLGSHKARRAPESKKRYALGKNDCFRRQSPALAELGTVNS